MLEIESTVVLVRPVGDNEGPETKSINGNNENLSQVLKPRVMSLLKLVGTVGTDLIIGSGSAFTKGDPLSMFIAYRLRDH